MFWRVMGRAVAIAAAASLVLAASAGADTSILGSVSLPAGGATSICGGIGPKCTVVEQQVASASAGSYVLRAPADGTIVSWSYRSANAAVGNQYSLRVLRPANAGETSFTAIATSTAPPLPDGDDLVRGPFGVNIPVKAGDRIGLESQGPSDFGVPVFHTARHDPSTGDGVVFFSPDIGDGSTATGTTTGGYDGSQVLVQATIETASPPPPPPVGCPPTCPPSLGPALNGRIAFASEQSGHREIYSMYPDGSHETRLTYDNQLNAEPSYSPDGSKIVFDSYRPPNSGIYTMNADGSNQRLLSRTDGSISEHPSYSPDGSKIIYWTRGFIYLINADGTGQRQLGVGFSPALSPDGSTIAFVRPMAGDTLGIALMNADGSNPRPLFDNQFRAADLPAFSPDGSKIAFQMDSPTSSYQIWTINSNGTGMRQLTFGPDGDHAPVFSPDGTKIAFFSYRPPPVEIYVMNVDGTHQQRITNDPGYNASPSWQALRATPRLISYHLSRPVFIAARTGPSAILNGRPGNARDAAARSLKRGTTVSFNLNEDATLRFGVQVPLAGRRGRGTRCVKPTRRNHRHRSCTRYRNLKGGFNIKGHIGNNSFLFTGRLKGRKLSPGHYALAAAPHALHKTGQIQRVRFRIVAALPARR